MNKRLHERIQRLQRLLAQEDELVVEVEDWTLSPEQLARRQEERAEAKREAQTQVEEPTE